MLKTLESKPMNESITHLKVPIEYEEKEYCLGPDGAVTDVTNVLRMISGRWTLQILFRLFAEPRVRHSQFLKSMPGISQKMLTQYLKKLENDGLINRIDFAVKPLRVEYELTTSGKDLIPVLISMRDFARNHRVLR